MGSLRNKRHLSLSLCLAAAQVQAAEPAEKAIEEKHIEETVVWGTKVYTSSVGLDAEAMDIKQADHISDLLRPIPGVDVGGAHSLNQRITIRSMDDKDLRISIDGANQNTYMYHHMGNLQIHADILQAVEVEVGNNSVVNGGLGGAVRFQTKEARDLLRAGERFGALGKLTFSDNASNNYAVSAYGQLSDTVDILGYYNFVDRKNYEVGGGKILNAEGNVIEGTDGKVRGLEGELTDALVKLGWNVTSNQRLKIGYETYADEGDYSYRPDMGLATDIVISETHNIPIVFPTEFTRDTLTLNYDLAIGNHTNVRTAVFRNESTLWRDETGLITSPRPATATVNQGEAENIGLNILADSALNLGVTHNLTYGIDHVEYKTGFTVDGIFRNGEQSTQAAVFIEDRIELTDSLSVTPGLRYDTANVETTVVDDNFTEALWALAGEYQISNHLLVRLSTTRLFRAPEIGEVFTGAGSDDTPNPGIDPETGSNSEVAVAYEISNFSAGVTFFRTQINDYIYDYAETGPSYWKDNVGDLTLDGFEGYLDLEKNGLRLLVTYASTDSELDAFQSYAALDGARLDREQGDSFSINLSYLFAPINTTVQWETLYVNDVRTGIDLDFTSDDADNAKASYVIHNLSGRWTADSTLKGLSVTLGVDNLFDKSYASQSSRSGTSFHPAFRQLYLTDYEPGRNLKAAIAYQF